MNQKSIIYTSNILNALYHLNESCLADIKLNGQPYIVGICTLTKDKHILSRDEKFIMDILLSWDSSINEDVTEKKEYTSIMLSDIDWIRNRYKKNKEHIQIAHEKYLSIFKALDNLFFVCCPKDKTYLNKNETLVHKLFNYENFIDENGNVNGIKYNFGELGNMLNEMKMKVTLNGNAFAYGLNEYMKYEILRYLVSSIYMNRVKKSEMCRSHRSIISALTGTNDISVSYLDELENKKYIHKYLSRYLSRLNDVLEFLQKCQFIKKYSIDKITNIREIKTGCGMVRIIPNMSKKSR